MVQVSSQRNEADASASYRALQAKYPSVLGDRQAVIRRIDLHDLQTLQFNLLKVTERTDDESQRSPSFVKGWVDTARALRKKYGARAVIITEGEAGCAIASDKYTARVPAFRIKAVDSTGAGDAFLGGMIAGGQSDL